jgi:hypothetical protein
VPKVCFLGGTKEKFAERPFAALCKLVLGGTETQKGARKAKQKTECRWAPESPEAVTEHKTVYKTAHTLQSKLLSVLAII